VHLLIPGYQQVRLLWASRNYSFYVVYIEAFYNRSRLHSTLGYTSPVQFLKDWNATQQEENQVA
jgi:transposase InsO family protein